MRTNPKNQVKSSSIFRARHHSKWYQKRSLEVLDYRSIISKGKISRVRASFRVWSVFLAKRITMATISSRPSRRGHWNLASRNKWSPNHLKIIRGCNLVPVWWTEAIAQVCNLSWIRPPRNSRGQIAPQCFLILASLGLLTIRQSSSSAKSYRR